MSPSDPSEMEQLDDLAIELTEAGRLARVANSNRERPEPEFATRLRIELLRMLPAGRGLLGAAPPNDRATGLPTPPSRPFDAPERLFDRRHATRPFAGHDRRLPDQFGDLETLDVRADHELVGPTIAGKRWVAAADAAGPTIAGKRWDAVEPLGRHFQPLESPQPTEFGREPDDTGKLTALQPSMRWHIPTRVMPSRHLAAGVAASVAVAALILGSGIFSMGKASDLAGDAVAATLVRGGSSSELVAGAELRPGDEIKVAAAGRATLQLGDNYVRLSGGADLRLDSLDPSQTKVEQIAGRVYHRVASGTTYLVATATVTWQGTATAFDLDRHLTPRGGEQVQGLALYSELGIHGPRIQEALTQGMSATVVLTADGMPDGTPVFEPIAAPTLADSWLVGNAGQDARLGLPLGLLASLLSPQPTAEPTATPTAEPTAPPIEQLTLAPTRAPTPKPTVAPTPRPTPKPAAKPTVAPTAAGPADLGALKIVQGTGNSYAFSWPKYTGKGFQYYKLVYEHYGKTPDFAGGSPYWTCNTAAKDNTWTGSIDPGDYAVRLQVVDESGGKPVIRAQTNVVRLKATAAATLPPTHDLGSLTVNDTPDGITFSWTGYTGGSFNYYKLVYEPTSSGKDPSYPGGSAYWAVPPAGATSWGPITIDPGDYNVRVQAIGYPTGYPQGYAYAQTAVTHVHISPVASPAP